jgi:glycosyltransferase involved in cell wall biosynthesis
MLAAMDVFLLTSLWEGLPRVIPQSMALRVPVVANRADGTVEAIDHGETGFLCDPGSLGEMTDYCVELLQDPNLRSKMGQRGRARVLGEFDLNVMIAEIDGLYEELLISKGVQKLHHRE